MTKFLNTKLHDVITKTESLTDLKAYNTKHLVHTCCEKMTNTLWGYKWQWCQIVHTNNYNRDSLATMHN